MSETVGLLYLRPGVPRCTHRRPFHDPDSDPRSKPFHLQPDRLETPVDRLETPVDRHIHKDSIIFYKSFERRFHVDSVSQKGETITVNFTLSY